MNTLLRTLSLFLLVAWLAYPSSAAVAPLHWVFLNTGPARDKVKSLSSEQVAKMQSDHVGNFGTQFDRGALLAAGPLGDNGFIRGTVLLNAQTSDQVAECFKTDPFVQNGILAVEAHPWQVDVLKFGPPLVPFQMTRHTLCVVKKSANWKPPKSEPGTDAMLKLFPGLVPQSRSGQLAVSGPFLDSSDRLGLLLFYSTNQAQIQAMMEQEPAIRKGLVSLEFHPQFMGKGTLRTPGEISTPPAPGHRTPLFDGKTFTGWQGDTERTWRIQKGALVGGSLTQTVPHNEFLCSTKEFGNFDLRLKVKLTGTGFVNGGIQIRSQHLKEPAFEMTGYQADMGEGYWGSLYDESRRNKVLAHTYTAVLNKIVKVGEWNDYVIRCEDRHIRLWLNGVLTVDYSEDDKDIPLTGLIAVQIHGGGKAEAAYKDITIEKLP